jgi:tetratricopeptide (TPR) repeat protein
MAKPIDTGDLDKAIKLVETAMKTEAKNAKLREQQRAKAEAALEAFNDNYAARTKETIARVDVLVTEYEKAVGIAQRELPKDHPLTTKLNGLIDLLKKIDYDRRIDELNKAIQAVEDWNVALEKTDQPKKAINLIEKSKAAIDSAKAEITKASGEYNKGAIAAKKDLDAVEDADVRKKLAAVLEGEL